MVVRGEKLQVLKQIVLKRPREDDVCNSNGRLFHLYNR